MVAVTDSLVFLALCWKNPEGLVSVHGIVIILFSLLLCDCVDKQCHLRQFCVGQAAIMPEYIQYVICMAGLKPGTPKGLVSRDV